MSKVLDLHNLHFIDLTHTLTPTIPQWGNGCGFQHKNISDYNDYPSNAKFRVQSIEMAAGIGTHMDAPAHCFENGKDIVSLSLEQLIVPCTVISVSEKSHENYSITPEDILEFEKKCGEINKNSVVIFYTGWDKFWHTPEKYRNNLVFPSVSAKAAELLLKRDIAGLGIDTLSADKKDSEFPVHQLILGAGKYLIENIANASLLPETGSTIIALPLKIQHGTESPIRLVGVTPLEAF
ncbi:MAG TPA: cyclase family protein [Gammaproteobacteria bacterium]|nr:cyclase family protein [Gammaproteobacteria bacterium]